MWDLLQLSAIILIFSLKIPWAGSSISTATQHVCNVPSCTCQGVRVTCSCTTNSTFQDAFVFHDESRKLEELVIHNCSRLTLPPQALSPESHLTRIEISHTQNIELQVESLSISRLRELVISNCSSLTVHQQAFKSYNQDSPSVRVNISSCETVSMRSQALASISSLSMRSVGDLQLEPHAFKVKVPTREPTIHLEFLNISTAAVTSSTFSSSFRSILIEDSRIDRIQTNAFSGFLTNTIHFRRTAVNRIERGAFSDQSVIESLTFSGCNISSLAQRSVVAGVTVFRLSGSVIQSMAKYGAVEAPVATAVIQNNTFRTLGEESLNFQMWNSVQFLGNSFGFLEEGAINAIQSPMDVSTAMFQFEDNIIGYANRMSLVTQIPVGVNVSISGNKFSHLCDCNMDAYIQSVTGHTGLTSPFQDLTPSVRNTSFCLLSPRDDPCYPDSSHADILDYQQLFCLPETFPACALTSTESTVDHSLANKFFDDFLLLFQVKTTKGILLFLLFCVLSSVIIVTICVGCIWIHRLVKRARLVRDNLSGSFQFNSGGEEKQILYGSDQTTCHSMQEEEPQYAEIVEVYPHSNEVTTLTEVSDYNTTSMPKSTTTTLPSLSTLPLRSKQSTETTSLLSSPAKPGGEEVEEAAGGSPAPPDLSRHTMETSIRFSMSETSLTDEIMLALSEKLNDPTMYCTVLDAKTGTTLQGRLANSVKQGEGEEELYCAPIYSDPSQQNL